MNLFSEIFDVIDRHPQEHQPDGALMAVLRQAALHTVKSSFEIGTEKCSFGPFGELVFPFHQMGAINSLDLFGIDELILFAFYKKNQNTYKNVVDFGANIGLHSIVLSKCDFAVRSFEPDEKHVTQFQNNLSLNNASVDIYNAAVSSQAGEAEFIRVLGNTTGSHLKGAKDSPYGPLETFSVKLEAAQPHLEWADLAKIDIEGHEADLLTALPREIWNETDALLEVGTKKNAEQIFDYFAGSNVSLFPQKIGWNKAADVDDIPTSHREGSLFLSTKSQMPW